MTMAIPYTSLRELLHEELRAVEETKTSELMGQLKHVRKDRFLSKDELILICRWKSPRALQLIKSNRPATIKRLTQAAFNTRSEREKLETLRQLKGVSIPMASAIMTLIWPERYGVIDKRVWQLLHDLGSVTKNPSGVNFTFDNWYSLLCKLRYHAKQMKVSVRAVEHTLFEYHKIVQTGNLYK